MEISFFVFWYSDSEAIFVGTDIFFIIQKYHLMGCLYWAGYLLFSISLYVFIWFYVFIITFDRNMTHYISLCRLWTIIVSILSLSHSLSLSFSLIHTHSLPLYLSLSIKHTLSKHASYDHNKTSFCLPTAAYMVVDGREGDNGFLMSALHIR